jgi:rare lipoprotein A
MQSARAKPAGIVALSLLLAACAGTPKPAPVSSQTSQSSARVKIGKPYSVFGKTYYPADDRSYDERGIASWYGPGFHALATANGETYDQNDTTAAHKTLPMPSFVEVENLDNGRKLTVRINDRGPFVDGRIIDLSRRSAQLLGVDKVGLARVRVRRIFPDAASLPPPAPSLPAAPAVAAVATPTVTTVALPSAAQQPVMGTRFIQVAALSDPGRIAWLSGYLGAFGRVVTQPAPGGLTRVRLGPYEDEVQANTVLAQLRSAGYAEARLVTP